MQNATHFLILMMFMGGLGVTSKAQAEKVHVVTRPASLVMYTTAWCHTCKQARAYLQRKKIPFVEYDVETTEKGRAAYKALNGYCIPILVKNGQRMDGFTPEEFERFNAAT